MFTVTQESLIDHLKQLDFEPEVQADTNQIYILLRHEKLEFPLFIRLLHEGELIQILTFIPCNVKAEEKPTADVARFLNILNKELDVPGFCLDEESRTVFYRLIIPTVDKKLAPKILEALMNTSRLVCQTFAQVIAGLAAGAITIDEILAKAKEAKAAGE